jgi:hypothetical protein
MMTDLHAMLAADTSPRPGRFPSVIARRARIRAELESAIDTEITPALAGDIAAAVELRLWAADARRKLTARSSVAELTAVVELESRAGEALAKLPLKAPTTISAVAIDVAA